MKEIIVKDGHDIILTRTPVGAHANVPHRLVCHSPTGFEWGYGGSGPADLALNILTVFVDDDSARGLHQSFKWEFIATMAHEGGVIKAQAIIEWIEANIKSIL
jgi:hypothetical protein